MVLLLAILFGFTTGVFGNSKLEATRISGFDIPMQIMANILKNNDVSQFNIIKNKDTKEDVKQNDPINNVNTKKGEDTRIVRKVNANKQINIVPAPARELVFEILSDDARIKAKQTLSKSSLNSKIRFQQSVENTKSKETLKSFDSVSFLVNSGFTAEQFERLFSKVNRN